MSRLAVIALIIAVATGAMRFIYLERDVRRELGGELSNALEVARMQVESLDESAVNDRTLSVLALSASINESRTSLITRRGDSIVILATASRDTTSHLLSRSIAVSAVPSRIRAGLERGRRTGGAGTGLTYPAAAYEMIPVNRNHQMLIREIDGYSLVARLLLPLSLDVLFIATLMIFAVAWLRSRARLGNLERERELSRVREDFLAGVSHELRTPLAQIRMFAELLRSGGMRRPEESRRALNVIEKESSRLSILVDNIFNYATISRGKGDATDPDAFTDVSRDVQYVVDAFAPLANEQDAKLVTSLESSSFAAVDSAKLRQILLNFLENAVKYGPRGQTVTIGSSELQGCVRVWVEDQGPGVSDQDREQIWKPFQRGAEAARSKAAGSGIGLSVVRDIASQYRGTTWVEDGSSGGARFVAEFAAVSSERQAAS
jgi:signal transduction histidine kinase